MSIFIAAFRWQPLCYKQSPAFTQKFQKKSLFISAKTYEKFIVCKDYCIAHRDDKTCFLPACKYHIILLGENEEWLHKIERAISFNQRNRGVDKMPSIAKKRLLRKKFKQHFMSALQKNKSTQTSGSVFAERIEKFKKTKFELELLKIVDCFLDGHGNYDSNLVSFTIKSL